MKNNGNKNIIVGGRAAERATGLSYSKLMNLAKEGHPFAYCDPYTHRYVFDVDHIISISHELFPKKQLSGEMERIKHITDGSGIYKIENENEIYIGKSVCLLNRLKYHLKNKFLDSSYNVSILKYVCWEDIKKETWEHIRELLKDAYYKDGNYTYDKLENTMSWVEDMLNNIPNIRKDYIDNELCFWECYYIEKYENDSLGKKLLNFGISKHEYPLDFVEDFSKYFPLKYTTRYTQWRRKSYL